MCSTSYAATFGHSRMVSALGQPLRIDVPVSQLTPDDLRSFHVSAAPASAWAQAGLTPPVDLESISVHLADGYTPGSKVIQLRSTEPFDKPVADLLLDVRTASGQQRHQVSLLTHASQDAIHAAGGVSQGPRVGDAGSPAGQATDQRVLRGMIRVKKGDTMFAIARRHAVPGVTVYQMMMALQRANPQAFIQGNINLVKAGATLAMPDMAGLTAISDKEARRLFAKQAQAFALYRQRLAATTSAVAKEGSAAQGEVTAAGQSEPAQAAPAPEDQLRLSRGQASPAASASGISGASGGSGTSAGGSAAVGSAGSAGGSNPSGSNDADVRADDSVAARKEIDESKERVSQLEQNVKHLNEALQSQGGAATDLIVDGAKGLSQSLADVANAVTSPGGTGAAPGSNGGAPESGTTAQSQGQGSRSAGSPAGSTAGGDRPAADGTSGAASTQGGAAGSGSTAASGSAAKGSAADGSATIGSTAGGAAAGGAVAGGAAASGSAGSGSAASASAANKAETSGSAAAGSNASTASGASVSEPAATPSSANGGKPDAASAGSSAAGTSAAGDKAGGGTSAAGVPATGVPATGAPANGTPGGNVALAPSASGSAGAPGNAAANNAANNADGTAAGSASKAPGSSAAPSGTAPAAGLASAAQGSGSGTSEGAPNRADQTKPSSGADRAGDVSEPISTRAEQTVSWIQEHMLGVITGLLALIVLVIAWLLRRANSGRDDGRADNSGLITEAMVREKLDQINLDLSQSSADDAPSRRR